MLALLAASCGPPDADEAGNESAPAETAGGPADHPALEGMVECLNDADEYAVRYPAGWHVNTGEVLGPCSLFDPAPIEIPMYSEIPHQIAVILDVEPVSFATVTGDVLGRRDLVRERTTVDGHEAMRIDGESTGEGLYDRGLRSYQYFVDLGERTMIATTYEGGSVPFERKRRILDAMMETMNLGHAR